MAKRGILFLLIIGLFLIVGCDGTPVSTTLEWTTVATEWTNDDDGQLSYVDHLDGSAHIDLGWYTDPSDTNTWQMCFLDSDDYEVANNVLTGKYTYNGDTVETFYDIVITFNYNENTNTVSFSCVGDGI
ncbi:MAG: hypothetical protein ACQ5SW_07620 [Sphaerochaetaceae bacterium]